MQITQGDIWDWHKSGHWVVITTNIGWKRDLANPMGAGVAKQAAKHYPQLPAWYGAICRTGGADTKVTVYEPGRLILFPTKALNKAEPWLSWRNDSTVELIAKSIEQLVALQPSIAKTPIVLPLPGCKNGGLTPPQVLPILQSALNDDFLLVLEKRGYE